MDRAVGIFKLKNPEISISICFSNEIMGTYSQNHIMNHVTMHPRRNKATLGTTAQTIYPRGSFTLLLGLLTLKVVVPYSLVVWTVSGSTLVMLVMNSSKYLQDFSKCVVLIIIWTS